MQRKFVKCDDPGHGWLKVPIVLLEKLGIAEKISSCSYQRKGIAYLEEDDDMSLFLLAYEEKTGISPTITYLTSASKQSRIRNYAVYAYSPPVGASQPCGSST